MRKRMLFGFTIITMLLVACTHAAQAAPTQAPASQAPTLTISSGDDQAVIDQARALGELYDLRVITSSDAADKSVVLSDAIAVTSVFPGHIILVWDQASDKDWVVPMAQLLKNGNRSFDISIEPGTDKSWVAQAQSIADGLK